MKLLTEEIKKQLPMPRDNGETAATNAVVKFFHPFSSWTWFASEAYAVLSDGQEMALTDPRADQAEDVIFFGLVKGLETELGYFSLSELQGVKIHGIGVERDLSFKPTPLSCLRENG